MFGPEGGHSTRSHVDRGHAESHLQRTLSPRRDTFHALREPVGAAHEVDRIGKQRLSGTGECCPMPTPGEQLASGLTLQELNLFGEVGLRGGKRLGRQPEVPGFGDSNEGANQP